MPWSASRGDVAWPTAATLAAPNERASRSSSQKRCTALADVNATHS